MNVHYLFDIDGTLTAPTQKMDSSSAMTFLTWMTNKRVFLVAGGNYENVKKQMPASILGRTHGIFSSMANEFWMGNKQVYKNTWEPDSNLLKFLSIKQQYTSFKLKPKFGEPRRNIDIRPGMLNFSIIGRNAGIQERIEYYKWDLKNKERENIANGIEMRFPDLDVRIGGQISLDIYPKGNDKSQASKWVRENIKGKIVFFGDKCSEGGNDYDIVVDIKKHKCDNYHNVKNYKETLKILQGKYE